MASRFWKVCVTCALAGITFIAHTFAGETVGRPPSDDGPKSTVRITTRWVEHAHDQDVCLATARKALGESGYFVEVTEISVFGLVEGRTASIRCDYKGVAFFVVAHRVRPDQATQDKIMDEIVLNFEGKE